MYSGLLGYVDVLASSTHAFPRYYRALLSLTSQIPFKERAFS